MTEPVSHYKDTIFQWDTLVAVSGQKEKFASAKIKTKEGPVQLNWNSFCFKKKTKFTIGVVKGRREFIKEMPWRRFLKNFIYRFVPFYDLKRCANFPSENYTCNFNMQ